MNKMLTCCLLAAATSMGYMGTTLASVIYANNAGTPRVESYDTSTGTKINSFLGNGSNGRGVVVVGDKVYTTNATNGQIGIFDRTTGTSLGTVNITNNGVAVGGISTIGWDGDHFWTSDYTGKNFAYKVDPVTGAVIKTITLSESRGFYDGLEYFNGKLIANEFDGGLLGGNRYSIYDTDGNLLVKNFIDTTGHGNGTGIAFDGIDFWISDILNNKVTHWSGADGSYLGELILVGSANAIEDLSFDYEGRPDTCRVNCEPNSVPEPATFALMALGLIGLLVISRRRKF